MGTARMGDDAALVGVRPVAAALGRRQRGVTDSSVFPTSTGYGPTLTLVALAIRATRALAGQEPLRTDRAAAVT